MDEKKQRSKIEEGEEKYGHVTADTCFNCEIPEKYCVGENCVSAFRRWKRREREAQVKARRRKMG